MGQMDAAAAVFAFVYENIFSNIILFLFHPAGIKRLEQFHFNFRRHPIQHTVVRPFGKARNRAQTQRFISEGYDSLADGHAGLLWCFGACK